MIATITNNQIGFYVDMMNHNHRKLIDLEAVRNVPILQIASDIGLVVKRNKAMCFGGHDNKTPSLTFTPSKNLWHCFGCGKKGGNIGLVLECLKLGSWKEAAKWIESNYLHGDSRITIKSMLRHASQNKSNLLKSENLHLPDPEIYEWIIKNSPLTEHGQNYLRSRGFLEETINYFKVSEICIQKNYLFELLHHFPKERLIKCGVIRISESKMRFIWNGSFLLFPFFRDSEIVYLQGRSLIHKNTSPKYLNPYGIKKPLYNESVIRTTEAGEPIILVEGVMDAMAGHQLGWNTVGVLGASSFADEWVSPLARNRIIVLPDNDQAGVIFKNKIRDAFRDVGVSISIAHIDGAKDLSELIEKSIRDI